MSLSAQSWGAATTTTTMCLQTVCSSMKLHRNIQGSWEIEAHSWRPRSRQPAAAYRGHHSWTRAPIMGHQLLFCNWMDKYIYFDIYPHFCIIKHGTDNNSTSKYKLNFLSLCNLRPFTSQPLQYFDDLLWHLNKPFTSFVALIATSVKLATELGEITFFVLANQN